MNDVDVQTAPWQKCSGRKARTKVNDLTLEDYLALDYSLDVVADPDGGYVLVYPDLPGCMTQVETLEEVGAAAQEIRHLWIETQYEDGFPIPLSRFAMKLAEAGEPPCGCGPGATECDYHLGWWDGYAAATATNQPNTGKSEDKK